MTTENDSPESQPDSAATAELEHGASSAKPPKAPKAEAPAEGAAEGAEAPVNTNENMRWYVVKVQSGREETIRDSIERRVKIEGLQESFGQILIPTEKVTEMRNNKRVVKEKKLFAGYMMVHLEFNDRMLYL
ncbi:MAG: transcription termination/antitermination NusG family protein, partial [Planctomycetota bacterium]